MKILKMSLLALLIAGGVACKEDEKEDPPKTKQELIVGQWNGTLLQEYEYNTSTNDTSSAQEVPGFFSANFKADGNYSLTVFQDTTKGTYAVQGNLLTTYIGSDTISLTITRLDEEVLILDQKEVDSTDVYELHLEFEKF